MKPEAEREVKVVMIYQADWGARLWGFVIPRTRFKGKSGRTTRARIHEFGFLSHRAATVEAIATLRRIGFVGDITFEEGQEP